MLYLQHKEGELKGNFGLLILCTVWQTQAERIWGSEIAPSRYDFQV